MNTEDGAPSVCPLTTADHRVGISLQAYGTPDAGLSYPSFLGLPAPSFPLLPGLSAPSFPGLPTSRSPWLLVFYSIVDGG